MKNLSSLCVATSLVLLSCASRERILLPGEPAREPSSIGVVALSTTNPTAANDDDEDNPGQYRTLRDQGIAHYRQSDLTRAVSHLETAFLVHPESKELWPRVLLFHSLASTGDYRGAKDVAEEIVKQQPYSPIGYLQVGIAQLWLSNPAQALQSFHRALEFGSHSPRVHFYLGLAQGMLRQPAARTKAFSDAEVEYLQILKANPEDFTANYELAYLYLFWDRELDEVPALIANAKSGLSQGTEQDLPQKLYQQFYLPVIEGIYLHRKKSTKASLQALFTSLANAPSGARADLAEILHYIGRNHLDSNQGSLARGFLERGLAMDPSGPYANEAKTLIREIASRGSTSP